MIAYNLVMVIDKTESKILTLYRVKEPYKGLCNLPGGKVEEHEDILTSAYRELEEETGILKTDIVLKPFIDYIWHPLNMKMYVFLGVLNKEVELVKEIHPLHWHDLDNDFFDMNIYAGEGNIGHMVEIYKANKKNI